MSIGLLKETSGNYNIFIESSMEEAINRTAASISQKKNNAIIVDENVYNFYSNYIELLREKAADKILIIKVSEENKNYDTIKIIYDFFMSNEINRSSTIISIGGGILGDLAGFAASTFMRGIPYISIPTTIISQTDSSVGGKVGYNYREIKNIIGNFYNPYGVIIPIEAAKSLDDKNFINGICEVIKYALISSEDLLKYIEDNIEGLIKRQEEILFQIIKRCLEIKISIVAGDYRDENIRNTLNFGHTAGHAIESHSNYAIMHGEAVALGILIAVKLSEYQLHLPEDIYQRLLNLYDKLGIPHSYKINNIDTLISIMKKDKKNDNDIRFVLLENIGKCKIKCKVTEEELTKAIKEGIGEN
ncbi:3-dehydroquinate synthase [Clostridium polynesiense]|uniref:3-dehydroquinate synthase n=1 Tax=Clostridium polynesiense TaxID=1325933 RepID=UPI00058D9134|nr:3-dehydroquinate synthase [Clostridium polynesiense]